MEKFEHLLTSLASIKQAFEDVQKLELDSQEKESKILERIVENLKPILPFIVEEIVIAEFITNSRKGDGFKFYNEKGVLLIDNFNEELTGDYPHEDNYKDFTGYQLWLLKTGKFLLLWRKGTYSAWQGEGGSWNTDEKLIDVSEIYQLPKEDTNNAYWTTSHHYYPRWIKEEGEGELNSRHDDVFSCIITALIVAFLKAIHHNKNKEQQLQSRLKTLKTIQSLL